MQAIPFDRLKHLYQNDAFAELVKDAVRFFNGTPVHTLPPPAHFAGTGVYALYYTGQTEPYTQYGLLNRLSYTHPIYVGKAVPKGWRQARNTAPQATAAKELSSRLREHSRSIDAVAGLNLSDFMCRFVIFEGTGSDMIGTLEAALIKLHRPLWNSIVDGFGNHDPGSGRYNQAKSDWDVLHPGRHWAERCTGLARERAPILADIASHLEALGTAV